MEKVAECLLPEFPGPDKDIAILNCSEAFPSEEAGVACMSAPDMWVLDRWMKAILRWKDLAAACPGVVVGPSNVTETLERL